MERRWNTAIPFIARGRAGTMVSELQGPAKATTTTKIDGEVESPTNLDHRFRSKVGSKDQRTKSFTDYGVEFHKSSDLERQLIFESRRQHRRSGIHHKGLVDGGECYSLPRTFKEHQFSDQVFNQEVDQELEERLVRMELKLDRLLQDSCRTHHSRRSRERWKFEDNGGSWRSSISRCQNPSPQHRLGDESFSVYEKNLDLRCRRCTHDVRQNFFEKSASTKRSHARSRHYTSAPTSGSEYSVPPSYKDCINPHGSSFPSDRDQDGESDGQSVNCIDGGGDGEDKPNTSNVEDVNRLDLDDDLLHLVFSFLSQKDVCKSGATSKQWQQASMHEDFWRCLNFEDMGISQQNFEAICHRYPSATEVNLSGIYNSEALAVEAVASLRQLETLILGKGQLGDGFFHALTECPALNSLSICDASLGVRCPQLQTLSLRRINMAHAGLNCPQLHELAFSSCHKLSDVEIRTIATSCPLLAFLDLSSCSCVTDETLREIAFACPSLSAFFLVEATSIEPIRKILGLNREVLWQHEGYLCQKKELVENRSAIRTRMQMVGWKDASYIVMGMGEQLNILEWLMLSGKLCRKKEHPFTACPEKVSYIKHVTKPLALAYKKLDESEYSAWNDVFLKAKTTIGPDWDALLELVADMIEKDLIFVGATAVEELSDCFDRGLQRYSSHKGPPKCHKNWQALEVMHRVAFRYGHLTWEWKRGIRSYLHPLIFAMLNKVLGVLGLDTPWFMTRGPRLLQSVFASFGDLYMYKLSQVMFNEQVAQWTLFCQLANWFMFYCITRTFSNSMEAILTVVGLYYWYRDRGPRKQVVFTSRMVALFVAALACVVRPTSAITWVYVGVSDPLGMQDWLHLLGFVFLEVACWIALLKGSKCIFTGDHLQLSPTLQGVDSSWKITGICTGDSQISTTSWNLLFMGEVLIQFLIWIRLLRSSKASCCVSVL